ncbi:hypothetical protein HDU81_007299 [Chytriomyces hyalinus]|nr:hypothetical protein HDU81_007299 [Chytriomyces hyalinus]
MGNQPSGETAPPQEPAPTSPTSTVSYASNQVPARGAAKPTARNNALVFNGFDGAPEREMRPAFSALIAAAAAERDRSEGAGTSGVVRLFISCGDTDWEWERNALVKDVWPFMRRFCRILDLDFEVIDPKWNIPNDSLYGDAESVNKALQESIETSFGPAFFCFLGDRYGRSTLPQTISLAEFEKIANSLDENDSEILYKWFALDTNPDPSVYRLRPAETIIDGISSSDAVVSAHASEAWKFSRRELIEVLREGCARGEISHDSDIYNTIYSSSTDIQVMHARTSRDKEILAVGDAEYLDRYFSFQRNFTKLPDGVSDALYFDDYPSSLANLASQLRSNRKFSVPWSATDQTGFSPTSDKAHAAYMKSFCDDVAKVLAESILKHYNHQAKLANKADLLEVEIVRHNSIAKRYVQNFTGREGVRSEVSRFLNSGDATENVLILYGPAGIGKSALLAKTVLDTSTPTSKYTTIFRFIGQTLDSSNINSTISSLCNQITRLYGVDDLRARISDEIEALSNASDSASISVSEHLFEILEFWPPVSPNGLKMGLRMAMALASAERPLLLVLDGLCGIETGSDPLNIDWLPATLPSNVKLIISALPVSKKHSLFLNLCTKYPALTPASSRESRVSHARYLELGALTPEESQMFVSSLLASNKRQLTDDQMSLFISKCKSSCMPLYIQAAWDLYASKWTSFDVSEYFRLKAETISGLFEDILESLETRYGSAFVGKLCSYLTVARCGLSKNELTDVISCDMDVFTDLYRAHEPTVLRINSQMVGKILDNLGSCVHIKVICGMETYYWSNSVFKKVAIERYLHDDRSLIIHRALSNYWLDKNSKDASKTGKSYGFHQTLLIASKPNKRRIASVGWHLLNGGGATMGEAVKTLQNISYIGAAIDAGLLDEVLACYKYSLDHMGDTVYSAQLTEYYRFLITNYSALSKSPRQLIPLAANLYTTSVLSGDARQWVKSRAPDLNWAEWLNKPTSRGEPVAILKYEDQSQELTVTGRDTFSSLIAVAGIKVYDMVPALLLFEIDYKATAVLPEERSRLRRQCLLEINEDEQQMPLTCCFSRSGKMIAVASRSLTFLKTTDLSQLRRVDDPSLPEGDIITAIAWTKDDGCVVTASDGSEPGRIVLWDAGSFTVLRAIKSQYPRQPVCTSYSTMGFWDEYRDLFILLDVDELASDADSGLFLQYIPTKAHSDPPVDGCARFALAHKSPLVLVATDDGKGYTMIDFRSKKPVARADVEIDSVRFVALSSDGSKIAIVPIEGRVIHILGLTESQEKPGKETPELPTFMHMGTILGADAEQPICHFSRNRLTIVTDGDSGTSQVWAINDLGDHSTVRYISLLPALSQGLCPIINSSSVLGWAISENRTEISLSEGKGKSKVRTYDVVSEEGYNSPSKGAMYKDMVVAISNHPDKPFTIVVTDQGQVTLLYNDNISIDQRAWIKGLWNSKKVEDGLIASLDLRELSTISCPTSVTFVPTTLTAVNPKDTPVGEILTFVTGHEDGSLHLWEWSPQTFDPKPVKSLHLKHGRVTSLSAANGGSHAVAATLDEKTVVIWDGNSEDLDALTVLIYPVEVSSNERGSLSMAANYHRWSSSSLWSSNGLSDSNLSRPTAVAFSSSNDKHVATGESEGQTTIWFLDSKTKRTLMTHPDKQSSSFSILAICWSTDDATVASFSEDKRVTVHNTSTGDLVWVHDLWMISSPPKVACFVFGARHLSVLDIYGSLTLVHLHGKWPSSKAFASSKTRLGAVRNLISSSASKISNMITAGSNSAEVHPITTPGFSSDPQELQEFEIQGWNQSVITKMNQNRLELNSRSSDQWQFTTGSGSHGHVGLLRLDSGLPRGVFEVICEIEIPANVGGLQTETQQIQLQFICGANEGSKQVIDPELEVLRGFIRYFPSEEQKQLAGLGVVNLHLGYIKTLCSINTCYIDLKRIPGEGEMFKLGAVHFVPADSALYEPVYHHPAELNPAFKRITRAFKEFEARHRRRSSILNLVVSERLSASASVPDLKAALEKASEEFDSKAHDLLMSPESAMSNESVVAEIPVASAPKPARMSMLQPLSKTVTSMVNSAGGYLGVGKLGEPAGRSAPTSFEAIQKEMEETRRKANEEAKRLEEEEEKLAAAMMKERENKALRAEFEKNAKQAISQMVKGERTSMAPGQAGFTRASLLFSANSAPRVPDDTTSFSSGALANSMGSVQEESEEEEYELEEETIENQELPPTGESDIEPNPVSPIIIVTPTFGINDGAGIESTVIDNEMVAATVDEVVAATLEEDIAAPEDKDISASENIASPDDDRITAAPVEDEFAHPEDEEIAYLEDDEATAPEDDEITAPKDEAIAAPEDVEVIGPEVEEITAPVEDEITAPKEEEITAPEEEEIAALEGEEITAPEDDEIIAPVVEEITAAQNEAITTPEDGEIIARDEEETSALDQEDMLALLNKLNVADDIHAGTTLQIADLAMNHEAEMRSVVQEATLKSMDIRSSYLDDSRSIPPASSKAIVVEDVFETVGNHESGCYSYSCRNGIETGGASCYSISHLQENADELNLIIVRNPSVEVVKPITVQETLITPALSIPEKHVVVTPGSSCYSYQCQHEIGGHSGSCYSISHLLALKGHHEAIRVLNPESAPSILPKTTAPSSLTVKDPEAVNELDAKIPVVTREGKLCCSHFYVIDTLKRLVPMIVIISVNDIPAVPNTPVADDVFATATLASSAVPIMSKISETESKAIAETVIQEFSDSLAEEDILSELGIEISSAQEITVEETTSLLSESEVIAELGELPAEEEIVIEQPYTVDTTERASNELDMFLESKLEETIDQAADDSDLRDSVLNSVQAPALYEDMFSSNGFSDDQIDLAETTAFSADLSKYSLSPEFGSKALTGESELFALEPSDPVKEFEAAIYGDDAADRNEDNFDQTELYGGETTSSSESLAFDAANEEEEVENVEEASNLDDLLHDDGDANEEMDSVEEETHVDKLNADATMEGSDFDLGDYGAEKGVDGKDADDFDFDDYGGGGEGEEEEEAGKVPVSADDLFSAQAYEDDSD